MSERFLFIRPDTYGDMVLFEPVLRLLRQYKPDCDIYTLIRDAYRDIVPVMPDTVHWLTFGANPYKDGPAECVEELMRLKSELNEIAPDVIVAPLYNNTWIEVVVGSWFPAARKISLGEVSTDSYTSAQLRRHFQIDPAAISFERVDVDVWMHETEKNSKLVSALCGTPISCPKPELKLTNEAEKEAEAILFRLSLHKNSWVAYGRVFAWSCK